MGRRRVFIWRVSIHTALVGLAALATAGAARAQGGPPFLTNDPGTPGNANWEINLAAMPLVTREAAAWQLPQIDLNFGLGDRIQLTYEVPYTLQANRRQSLHGDWGNGFPGIKWRFLDTGEDGWQLSVFPQLQTGGSGAARDVGIAAPAPRYLLPLAAATRLGPIDVDAEAGYYLPGHGARERILGLVAGHEFNARLELDVELYDDRASGAPPQFTTLDIGGRFRLAPGLIALFMAGGSVAGRNGYLGIQILLSHYGRTLLGAPGPMQGSVQPAASIASANAPRMPAALPRPGGAT
jgi:hypothetical protein